jgi:hypothetical protein
MYVCIYVCLCIWGWLEVVNADPEGGDSGKVYVYMCINIYMYTHLFMCIDTYTYINIYI